jgi:hypothetical protein
MTPVLNISPRKSSALIWFESAESFERVQAGSAELTRLTSSGYVIATWQDGEKRIISSDSLTSVSAKP